jgi:hypothetical protein
VRAHTRKSRSRKTPHLRDFSGTELRFPVTTAFVRSDREINDNQKPEGFSTVEKPTTNGATVLINTVPVVLNFRSSLGDLGVLWVSAVIVF